ncbi:uncharacterized protein [Pyxicephalus adspersus]|uniref:C2H2-type domain-containing protein n=1 Tax=Pyxicephalus adspersus TaxID=30357 RepID=A0AAV3A346_PYXAD|nr:TPA: hypothetical protein GDO54_012928 [Pyxicephalus adspersus]
MQNSERSTRFGRKLSEHTASPGPESHGDPGQYLCIECSETFDTRLELNSHRQSHVTKKQFTCTHCGRGFHHQVFLQMHERSHEDGAPVRSTSRIISTRSSKISDVVKPTYTKPQRLLNSIVEIRNEQKVCQTFTPKEFVTRRSHGAASPSGQKKDSLEKKNLFQLRISKYSDTTVHLLDSFGNSIEILADVFNTYTIGEPNKNGLTTNNDEACEKNDEASSNDLTEKPSVSLQSNPTEPSQLETDGDLFTSLEPITSNASENLDSGEPAPSAPQLMESPSPETTEAASNIDLKADNSVSATYRPVHAEDHLYTSLEDAAGPNSLQKGPQTLQEVNQTAEHSSVLVTSPADKPIDGTNPSIAPLPAEVLSKDNFMSDDPGSDCNKLPDEMAEEVIADVEQKQDLTSLKPDSETKRDPICPEQNLTVETDICMTRDIGEVSAERSLQVDSKDPEKDCKLIVEEDNHEEMVIDDKREEDIFDRDIFPLETPMEVCDKGLASMVEAANIVCAGEAHSTKMVQEKESDICLNGSDMTYISESEMIKLLEQDKDDMPDDEPITSSPKDIENTEISQKEGADAFSEPKAETELRAEHSTDDGVLSGEHIAEDASDIQHHHMKTDNVSLTPEDHNLSNGPTFQATSEEKMDSNSNLQGSFLTNFELGLGDDKSQDPTESVLTQDSVSKNCPEQEVMDLQPKDNPDISQPEQALPCGDENREPCGLSPDKREVNSVEDSTLSKTEDHNRPKENIDVCVTLEDNECDENKMQQMNPLESFSVNRAVMESDEETPSSADHKDLFAATVCSNEPGQDKLLECLGDNLPPSQKELSDSNPLLKHDRETEETFQNPERISKPKDANVDPEMEKPPSDILDYLRNTGDGGDSNIAASGEKNKGMPDMEVKQDVLPKENEKIIEKNDEQTDICTQKQTTDLSSDRFSLSTTERVGSKESCNEFGELHATKTDLGKDIKEMIQDPGAAFPKADNEEEMEGDGSATKQISDVISPVARPVFQSSVEDLLDDSDLLENDHQEDADIKGKPSKPLGVGGACLKCGRKIRRGRRELVWLPVCFKCRMAAKKQERLSNQEINDGLGLASLSRKTEICSAEICDSNLKEGILEEPNTILDPLAAGNEQEALGSAAKKMYKCPKCDEAFKIPALLAGHIKCHTLPQCLTCGCQVRLKYKMKRIPRRCQKCFQQLKEKLRAEKAEEGSGEEDSMVSDDNDAGSLADINPDDDELSDKDISLEKAKRKLLKNSMPSTSAYVDELELNESSAGRVDKETEQEIESSDELDISDQNLGLPDGEKPRLCSQCGKAFKCNRSLNLHLLSHTGIQCESCGCRLPKKRRVGRWSKKCRACRLHVKGKLLDGNEDEMSLCSDKLIKQKNAASLRLKAKQTKMMKNAKIQSIIKKKKELKWMNMLLAVKGLMDKSRKKKENALQVANPSKKNENSEGEKCESSSGDNASNYPGYPDMQKAGSSNTSCPPNKALSGTPKQGRKCLYKEKNIIKVEENEVLPFISTSADSISSAFIKEEETWQCFECNQTCPNSEALVDHQRSHISDQTFTCTQCPQVFSSEEYLNIHIHAHDERRPFRCPECDKTFTRRNHLGVHMRVHTGSRPFACPDCPCRFRQKVTLIAHRYSHRNYQLLFTKPFQCSVCSKSFKQKERLVVHERLHTGECPFSCKDCDKVFPSKARLYVHRKMHKMFKASSSIEQSLGCKEVSERQPFKCQDCGKVCSTKASFVLHRKVHRISCGPLQSIKREENEEMHPFSCRECNKVFSSKASLSMHLKIHSVHKATAKSDMGPDFKECFPCKDCGKVCSTKASFVLHRKVHKSPSAAEPNLVIKMESEAPSFVCKDCNKVCSTKASLVLHCKVHKTPTDTETQPFRCKDCDMVCSTKASFVLHRKVHRSPSINQQSSMTDTEPQSYSCKHCDMVCSTKASFVLHSKVHKSLSIDEQDLKANADPQVFNCKHCDMVCSTKASFVLHSKVHRSSLGEQSPKKVERPQSFSCKHCDMVCSTKASFVLHSKKHRSLFGGEQSPKTSEEPHSYQCKHCDMVCSTKASFVLHSKVHRSLVGEQSLNAGEPQSYSCKKCDMVCSTKASFVLHSKVHKSGPNFQAGTEENFYTCKDCNKVCSTKASFILHCKVHKTERSPKGDGAEPFPCKDCSKIFSSKGRLSAHSKVHEDPSNPEQSIDNEIDAEQPKKANEDKPYSCSICGLRFIKLKMLVRHKAVHGQRTVTPCIHCGKRFLYMKSLFNHIKMCQSKGKGKKLLLLKKVAAKRKIPKDGDSTSSEGESTLKKRKIEEKQKAQKLKNKNLAAKAKKIVIKEKGKDKSDPKSKEKRAKGEGEISSEGEGKKMEKQSDGKQEKPSDQTAKEPTLKKDIKIKKIKKELGKDKPQKVVGGGTKKWRMLAASTVKKKNLQAILIGGKKKYILKKKVHLKSKPGGKVGKD